MFRCRKNGKITEERKQQLLNGIPEGYVLNEEEEAELYTSFMSTPALKRPQPNEATVEEAKEQSKDNRENPEESAKEETGKKSKTDERTTEQIDKEDEPAAKKKKTQNESRYNLRPRKTATTTILLTLCCLITAISAECPSWA
uniref:Uncharacterized protein n=1 Tax=Panagrolaimus superbus TaxID=310955 RepID=A0A914YFJ9_9BILA